uniref:Uncharacterized protein n=1 Tax=Glossina pallidipes TaxID=7398 RepID=A0A1B0AFV4_GLOPL
MGLKDFGWHIANATSEIRGYHGLEPHKRNVGEKTNYDNKINIYKNIVGKNDSPVRASVVTLQVGDTYTEKIH